MNNADTYRNHITNVGVTSVVNYSIYIGAIYLACSDGGSSWKLEIRDKGSPAMAIVPMHNIQPTSDGMPQVVDFKDKPVYMKNGVEIATSGGTAGEVDIWIIAINQPNQN